MIGFNLLDLLALGVALSIFLLFLVVHIRLMRSDEKRPANQAILRSFLLGILMYALILAYVGWLLPSPYDDSRGALASAAFASTCIYTLLVFHYLVWIFGMGEAAIRIRLLRELDARPTKSATLNEIYEGYDAEKILQRRLERLTGSGHLGTDGKFYWVSNRILVIQVLTERVLKYFLGIST